MSDIYPPAALIPAQFPTPFCEDTLTPDVAAALRQSAERIRRLGEEQTEAILAIGRELIAVKELLPLDQLDPWIRKEFDMTDETAGVYMGAAGKIAAVPVSCKRPPKPKLISWKPDRERQKGPCGYADIELPSGFRLDAIPWEELNAKAIPATAIAKISSTAFMRRLFLWSDILRVSRAVESDSPSH